MPRRPPDTPLVPRTLLAPAEVWAALDREAHLAGLSCSELLRRRWRLMVVEEWLAVCDEPRREAQT